MKSARPLLPKLFSQREHVDAMPLFECQDACVVLLGMMVRAKWDAERIAWLRADALIASIIDMRRFDPARACAADRAISPANPL